MTDRPFHHLSGEDLRKRLKRADAKLGDHIDRLQMTDAAFRETLLLALELQAEADARRGG